MINQSPCTTIFNLPIRILEKIFILLIENKQFSDLNSCKQIPLFSKVIFALKRYYMLHLYNRLSKCRYISLRQ